MSDKLHSMYIVSNKTESKKSKISEIKKVFLLYIKVIPNHFAPLLLVHSLKEQQGFPNSVKQQYNLHAIYSVKLT